MRFAIAAKDLYQDVFDVLIDKGWTPVKFFSNPVPSSSLFNSNSYVVGRAEALGIPIQLSRITDDDLRELAVRGCDVLVVAGHRWRIGNWQAHIPHAVNFHPSPLPVGRGRYPAVRAVLDGYSDWGVTCHRLAADFDTGDILAREVFPLTAQECHESLTLKVQMATKRLAGRVADDFEALWAAAEPQVGGSYWPLWSQDDRVLDFAKPVETILRKVRAFGLLETLVQTNGGQLRVRRAVGWTEAHGHTPGRVVQKHNGMVVFAAADGYIGLVEWQFA